MKTLSFFSAITFLTISSLNAVLTPQQRTAVETFCTEEESTMMVEYPYKPFCESFLAKPWGDARDIGGNVSTTFNLYYKSRTAAQNLLNALGVSSEYKLD